MSSKTCTKCKVTRPIAEFYKHKRSADGRAYQCSHCTKAASKEYAQSNPARTNEYNREYYAANRTRERIRVRLQRYGLTQEQYSTLWADHAGGCAICYIALLDVGDYESGNKRPDNACCIDHCHSTGKVRGLLCIKCNLMLGYARDSSTILQAGIEYLDHVNE